VSSCDAASTNYVLLEQMGKCYQTSSKTSTLSTCASK
jgi:hypothetical protein